MPPSLTFIGSVTLGVAIPLLLNVALAIELVIPGLLAELNAKIAGYAKLAVSLGIKPPSLTGSIDLAAKIAAALNASIGFTPPSVNFAASAVLALIGEIELKLGGLQAALDLALQIKGIAAAAGVKLFIYEGRLIDLGATLDAQVAAKASLDMNVPIFLPLLVVDSSASPETVTALKTLFKTS
jgi:hypothetical protein